MTTHGSLKVPTLLRLLVRHLDGCFLEGSVTFTTRTLDAFRQSDEGWRGKLLVPGLTLGTVE